MVPQTFNRILRLPEAINTTGNARSTIYKGMAEGTFPKAIKIGPRAVGWLESDIQKWLADRVAASRAE